MSREMCLGCHGNGWITAGLEKCPNCNGTGEIDMIIETDADAAEMNREIRIQVDEFHKELMKLLGYANAMLLVKDGQIWVEMQEVKSGSSIVQHSTEFKLGHQYTYYG